MASSCEQGNEPSGTIKGREFLNKPRQYQLHKQDSAPYSSLLNHEGPLTSELF
jgi:hypothetical protein